MSRIKEFDSTYAFYIERDTVVCVRYRVFPDFVRFEVVSAETYHPSEYEDLYFNMIDKDRDIVEDFHNAELLLTGYCEGGSMYLATEAIQSRPAEYIQDIATIIHRDVLRSCTSLRDSEPIDRAEKVSL